MPNSLQIEKVAGFAYLSLPTTATNYNNHVYCSKSNYCNNFNCTFFNLAHIENRLDLSIRIGQWITFMHRNCFGNGAHIHKLL